MRNLLFERINFIKKTANGYNIRGSKRRRWMKFLACLIALVLAGGCTAMDKGYSLEPGKVKIFELKTGKIEEVEKVVKPDAEWKKLLSPEELVEGNWWNDTFWGVCNGEGQNNLGKILMKIRKEIS